MHKTFCVVRYIFSFIEFPTPLAYENQFSGRFSIDRGFTRLAGLPAVFLVRRLCGGLARRYSGGLAC